MASTTKPLRRTKATLTLLEVLAGDPDREHHGYELAQHMNSHQAAYQILDRLEARNLVTSRWDLTSRPRRCYRLTAEGVALAESVTP